MAKLKRFELVEVNQVSYGLSDRDEIGHHGGVMADLRERPKEEKRGKKGRLGTPRSPSTCLD